MSRVFLAWASSPHSTPCTHATRRRPAVTLHLFRALVTGCRQISLEGPIRARAVPSQGQSWAPARLFQWPCPRLVSFVSVCSRVFAAHISLSSPPLCRCRGDRSVLVIVPSKAEAVAAAAAAAVLAAGDLGGGCSMAGGRRQKGMYLRARMIEWLLWLHHGFYHPCLG